MNYKTLCVVCLALFVAGCGMAEYAPPKENEAHALLKLKYKYSAVRPGTLGARMHIRHDAKDDDDRFSVAFNQSYGSVSDKNTSPDIPMTAVKVYPGKKADVRMAVYFYWYTTQTHMVMVGKTQQMQTTQVYHEAACTVQTSFVPEAGKTYLLDYSSPNIDKDCIANAYEQTLRAGGTFKLMKVGTSKTL